MLQIQCLVFQVGNILQIVSVFICLICFKIPQDMSAYVKKVHFKLHESYANPQRSMFLFMQANIHWIKYALHCGQHLSL